MAVIIDESCITCDACAQQCPVNAILDDGLNPTGNKRYYVQPEKCIECVGVFDDPQCAAICPSIGCITWDMPFTQEFEEHFTQAGVYALAKAKEGKIHRDQKFRSDIPLSRRGIKEKVQLEPSEGEIG